MASDERAEEQELLADLEARTGRDLAGWMAAIAAQDFKDKNETIDWLRAQGIPFARASWLERIHNNGGKPIYADQSDRAEKGKPPAPPSCVPAQRPDTANRPAQRGGAQEEQLEKLIAAAKGYRPLYHLLEGEVRNTIPALNLLPRSTYISFAAPCEFAALALTASELRLGLDLGARSFDALLQKPKLKGTGPSISHMVVLTDARQVNSELMELVKSANARVNG
jgi:hypothetical protein